MGVPTKVISSSIPFQDGAGNVVANGTLRLQLTQNATVTSGGGQVTTEPIFFLLDANGKIPANSVCWFNDELTPSGTAYHATLVAKNGCRTLVDYGNWVLSGASVDVSSIVATSTTVSYANAVLTNPPGGALQTIAGPLNVKTFENIRYADQFSGADIGAKVNAAFADLGGVRGTIIIPSGSYTYTTDISLGGPVTLAGEVDAILNYTGTGKAIKLGPDNLNVSTYSPDPYIVDGLELQGGNSATHGIYINRWIVAARIYNTVFMNFGNSTAYNIFAQFNNWDTRIDRVTMWGVAPPGKAYNGICLNGYDTDNTTADNGNSFIRITNCLIQNSQGGGTGVLLNGFKSQILNSTVSGFSPNVRFRRWGNSSELIGVYSEVINTAAGVYSYQFGDVAGDPSPSIGSFIDGLNFKDVFVNVHNTDAIATTAHPIGPSTASAALQNALLENFAVAQITSGQPIVTLNNIASQLGNVANFTRYSITNNLALPFAVATGSKLHTVAGSISNWAGTDENLTSYGGLRVNGVSPGTTNQAVFNNNADQQQNVVIQGGATADQDLNLMFNDHSGVLKGRINQDTSLNLNLVANNITGIQILSTGHIYINKIVDNYNGIATVSNGIPVEYAKVDLTAQTADIGATLLYAVPASGAGMYRISVYIVVTSVGTTSTLPAVSIAWTDKENNTAKTAAWTSTDAGNVLTTSQIAAFPVSAKASTNINYSTSGYASSGSAMQFALHIKLEYLG